VREKVQTFFDTNISSKTLFFNNMARSILKQLLVLFLKNVFFYSLKVKVSYDDNFKAKFGDDAVNAARRVMAQAQNLFKLKDSLKTEINFKIDSNVEYKSGRWVAEKDL
jgi:hypothetical protein